MKWIRVAGFTIVFIVLLFVPRFEFGQRMGHRSVSVYMSEITAHTFINIILLILACITFYLVFLYF